MTEPDAAWQPEDPDPESLVGAYTDDLPAESFPAEAQFTDEEWRYLVAVRDRPPR